MFEGSEEGFDRKAFRRVEAGVLLALVGGMLAVVTAGASQEATFPSWSPFALPGFEMTIPLLPPFGESPEAIEEWVERLWLTIAYGVTIVVYYVTLAGFALGWLLITWGAGPLGKADTKVERLLDRLQD